VARVRKEVRTKVMIAILEAVRVAMMRMAPVVGLFGVLLISLPFISMLILGQPADTRQEYQLQELENQVKGQGGLEEMIQRIDRRITVLETIQQQNEGNSPWQRGTSVGTGLLLIEAAFRIGKGKYAVTVKEMAKEKGDNDE